MDKEIISFDDVVEKHEFHQHRSPISIYDVNVDRIVVSNRVPFGKKGFKNFIGNVDVIWKCKNVKPLCVMLPKISAFERDFDETKYMYFLIKK